MDAYTIDVHTHAFPQKIAASAVDTLAHNAGLPIRTNGTLASVLEAMDAGSITHSFICNIATNPRQMHNVNTFAIENNGGRFVCLGSIHPDHPDWEEELLRLRDAGIQGIKLHPDYQNFVVDQPRMLRIYERLIDLGFFVLLHSGHDLGIGYPIHCTPRRFRAVMQRVDTSRFILAHMGGYNVWQETLEYIAGQNVYLDTSFSLSGRMPKELFLRIVEKHGYQRILFGSDMPWCCPKDDISHLRRIVPDAQRQQAILGGNAAQLLGWQ